MFGGSGGIVVVSSCLDGPRVHRPGDSAWMEARVDSRQVTGAGTTKLAATDVQVKRGLDALRCVPHWPEVRARSSGRAAPDARSVCYSLRIGKEDRTKLARGGSQAIQLQGRGPSEGGLPGCLRGVPCHAGGQWVVLLARQTLYGSLVTLAYIVSCAALLWIPKWVNSCTNAKRSRLHPVLVHSGILPPQEATGTLTTSEE